MNGFCRLVMNILPTVVKRLVKAGGVGGERRNVEVL